MKNFEGLGNGNLKHTGWREALLPFVDDEAEVFVDPADDDGEPSYALTNKVLSFGLNDTEKIAIIESDSDVIEVDNLSCTGGASATIAGNFAVRHSGTVNAHLYGGSVRTVEPADIAMDDPSKEPLVIWWLPDREHGEVCGEVVVITNPNPLPTPTGTDPDPALNPGPSPDENGNYPPPPPSPGYVGGLKGEWRTVVAWEVPDLSGPIITTRVDANLNYPYGIGNALDLPADQRNQYWKPSEFAPLGTHSVVYTGQLWIPHTGTISFYSAYDDATILTIGGASIIDQWCVCWSDWIIPVGQFEGTGGQWVDVYLATANVNGPSMFRLQWSYDGQTQQDIPDEYFQTQP